MKVIVGQKDRTADMRFTALMFAALLLGAVGGMVYERAYGTISSTPSQIVCSLLSSMQMPARTLWCNPVSRSLMAASLPHGQQEPMEAAP